MELHEKFSELISRVNNKESLSSFTETERSIYLITSMACEIQINSFADVFTQHFNRHEVQLTIDSLNSLDFDPLAQELQLIHDALVKENCYNGEGYFDADFDELPDNILQRIEDFSLKFNDQKIFSDFDEKLLKLWQSERK